MAWPPGSPIAADKANATEQVDDHAPHHNALATAINDLVTFGPVGSSDVTLIEQVTQTAYDALDPPVATTLYIIVGA